MRKLLAMLLIAATAAPALAAPVPYAYRIDQRGSVKFSDEMLAQLEMMERFAIGTDSGDAWFPVGPACSPCFGTLSVSQKRDRVLGGGDRVADGKPIACVDVPDRKQTLICFDTSQVTTRKDDCSATDLKAVIP